MVISDVQNLQFIDQSLQEDVLGTNEELPGHGNYDAALCSFSSVILEKTFYNLAVCRLCGAG